MWGAAAPKRGSLVSSRGWKAARLPLLSKVRTSGWAGNKFIPSEMFSAVSWGGTHGTFLIPGYTSPTLLRWLPAHGTNPAWKDSQKRTQGITGKASPGVLPAGLSLSEGLVWGACLFLSLCT